MSKPIIQVLLIEDNPADALLLREAAREDSLSAFEFTVAGSLSSALEFLNNMDVDVILLDLGLPDSQGFKSFETVHNAFPEKPVVVISGTADQRLALEVVQSGAQDFLVKGPTGWEVSSRAMRYAIERKRIFELVDFHGRSQSQGGVFISYSHIDKELVEAVAARFEIDGINYWKDDKDILAGQDIDKAISEGIQKNWIFLIVLTPTSLKSKWVEREFDEASHEEIEGKKFIIPIVGNGLDLSNVPSRIRRKLCVDMNSDFEDGYTLLRKSILYHMAKFNKGLGEFESAS